MENLANFLWLLFSGKYHFNIMFHKDSQIHFLLSSFQNINTQWSMRQNKFLWEKCPFYVSHITNTNLEGRDKLGINRYTLLRLLLSHFNRVWLCVTPWTAARQAPLSMGFSRQEYWSALPFPSPEDLLTQGSNPGLLHCRQILYRWATGKSYITGGSVNYITALEDF